MGPRLTVRPWMNFYLAILFTRSVAERHVDHDQSTLGEYRGNNVTDRNDLDDKGFPLSDVLNVKVALYAVPGLLLVIIVLISCFFSYKCYTHRRSGRCPFKLCRLGSAGCRSRACAGRTRSGEAGSEGDLHNSCSVETIYDPARHCCPCNHRQFHHQWPTAAPARVTSPPAYPRRSENSITDASTSPSRAELSRSAFQTCGHRSNCSCSLELREMTDTHSENDDPVTSPWHGPMNIECPGLFDTFPAPLRDLFVPGQCSERRTVAGKLVVSLAKLVDSRGDCLVLDNMGITLQVPAGAVPCGQKQLVTLALDWDLTDSPEMDNRQALVSPVVYCGPHGLRLDRPCTLSLKHCAFDPRMVQVWSSQTELVDRKDWQEMCSADEASGAVAMTTDECQVRLQHFSLFTCVQVPPPGATGKKWLQVAAFCAPLQRQVHHYQVRVYFLNKTPCALQWAIQNEAKFGFRLACPERTFLFHGCGEDLHLTVGYISRGWEAVSAGSTRDEDSVHDCGDIPYHSVWHGKCPHLTFCFRRRCLLPDQPQLLSNSSLPPACSSSRCDSLPSSRFHASGGRSESSMPARMPAHAREIGLHLSVFQDSTANCPDRINLLLTESPEFRGAASAGGGVSGGGGAGEVGLGGLGPPQDGSILGCFPTHLLPTCDTHPISISMPPVSVPGSKGVRIIGKVRIDNSSASGPNVLVDFDSDLDCVASAWPYFALGETRLRHGGAGPEAEAWPPEGGEDFDEASYPQDLKVNLKVKLDPPCPLGKNWTMLASMLGLDKYIRWLSAQADPTLCVLQFMEVKNMSLHCLSLLLTQIGRLDAARDVDDVIRKLQGHPAMTPPRYVSEVEIVRRQQAAVMSQRLNEDFARRHQDPATSQPGYADGVTSQPGYADGVTSQPGYADGLTQELLSPFPDSSHDTLTKEVVMTSQSRGEGQEHAFPPSDDEDVQPGFFPF